MSSIDVREKFKKHELSGEVSCILYGKDGESGEEKAEYKSTHLYGDYSDNIYVHTSSHTEHHSEDILFLFSKDLIPGTYHYFPDFPNVIDFVCDARYAPAWRPQSGLFVLEKNSVGVIKGKFRFHKEPGNKGFAVSDGEFFVNFPTSVS
ncbi:MULTISPECIES: hypothetical protein [Pseudomonas]|uniref:hypothetical protein n=1 Tax=Pseudomonas TaxID=286 RepID=UPI0012DE0008|nr:MULTISPECIES: hypothetical protein [Pseudomonas]